LNSESWFLLQSGPGEPAWNMALDEALMEAAPEISKPVLRFYSWTEPAATFGYSQKISEIEKATLLRPLVRRPTGGGLVPHDADWTYSLIFPRGHFWYEWNAEESYRQLHEWLRSAFAKMKVATTLSPCCLKEMPGQCFRGAEKHDLLWNGRKIAGAAQRRARQGLLIQGSVQPPLIGLAKIDWQEAMCGIATEQWQVRWSDFEIETSLRERAEALAREKYSQETFNRKR
jgi:lipoate-protein ligase A